jgi:hypothetical protein
VLLSLNNDRLSNWYLGALLSWVICFLFFGIPIFHLGFGFSIVKIGISLGICCGVQLAVVPWLFSARATSQNPDGLIGRRIIVVVVWQSLTALFLAYYIQRGWHSTQAAQQARNIMFVTLVVFFAIGLILYCNTRSIARMLRFFRSKNRVSPGSDDLYRLK